MTKSHQNGFEQVSIGEFCETGSGGTPSRQKAAEYFGGTIPWVKSGELRENIITSTEESITDIGLKESSAKLLPRNTLLVALYGATVGRIGVLGIEAATNQAVCYIIPDERRVNRQYLFYALRVQVPFWLSKRVGGGQPNISQGIIKQTKIPLPPLPEQRRIADILDKADTIRRKRKEANQLASSIATSLCEDRFGDPVNNRKGWGVVAMESLYAIAPNYGTMIVPSESRKRWLDLRVANIQNGVLDLSDKKYVDLPEDAIYRHEVRKGDLLLARAIGSIDHLGKCFIADPGEDQWAFDSHLMRIRFDTTKVEPRYVHAFLISPGGRHEFLRNSRRSAVQFNINTKEMARIQITLPPLDVQREFVRDLDRLSSITRCQIESDAKISNLFNSLVQRAFRGEL